MVQAGTESSGERKNKGLGARVLSIPLVLPGDGSKESQRRLIPVQSVSA